METQGSTKTNNDQISELGQRVARMETNMAHMETNMARIETKMDFMATHKDIAAVRTEVEGTRTEVASLKGELLTEIAGIKTLVANRGASMQRWLLGITATTVVGVSSAMAGGMAKRIYPRTLSHCRSRVAGREE